MTSRRAALGLALVLVVPGAAAAQPASLEGAREALPAFCRSVSIAPLR